MRRDRTKFLHDWFKSPSRKPLVIRGARQVGKTWLIRDFAQSSGCKLVEINFEKRPEMASLFSSNDVQEILVNLKAFVGGEINPSSSLLFLDEIQAAPQLLSKLRWFAEDIPELCVVAAGSLLEFTLGQHEFSMPVGRINYMYLEPFSFEEFLDAAGERNLVQYLHQYEWKIEIPEAIHVKLSKLMKEYMLVGGMPAAVSTWVGSRNPNLVNQIHFDLLATYRDDFSKYSGRLSVDRLEDVMNAIPKQLGKKFVYSKANPSVKSPPLKQALDLLAMARVCHRVESTSANGLPLGAEVNEKFIKVIMLDCGLCSASLGLTMQQLHGMEELSLINSGGIAEQLVGQMLRSLPPPYVPPHLYYWLREKRGGSAELDYVIQYENIVVPVEVKAGSTGKLKSLHQFMKEKQRELAIRVNSSPPKKGQIHVKDSDGAAIKYTLLSLPFYLVGQLHRLVSSG